MDTLLSILRAAAVNLGWQLFILAGPVVLLCVFLHLLQRVLSQRMASLLGGASVYVTGWLGTPVHELSHALMCKVFGHRVVELVLFRPDEDGRLGYVKHSYNKKSIYQRVGNFFIGVAPLFGGAAVLLLLLWFVHPDPAALDNVDLSAVTQTDGVLAKLVVIGKLGWTLALALFAPAHLGTWQFWLFVYLALAVGSHLAPSRVDMRNGFSGGVLCLVILFGVNLALATFGVDLHEQLQGVLPLLSPLLAMLFLAVVLNLTWLTVLTPLTWLRGRG